MLLIGHVQAQTTSTDSVSSAESAPVHVPDRPSTALFKGQPGVPETDIFFDPTTHVVTAKLLVQDPQGYFIPNIRRDNFAVYEDGVRQKNASVEVEHIPVSLGLLAEYGGRYQSLNYANDVYYTWDPRQNGYVVVDPPANADNPSAPPASAADDLIIYPKNGQDPKQQAADRYDCHSWSKAQSGFDPTQTGGGVAPDKRASGRDAYDRAMSACLTGRGYEVR